MTFEGAEALPPQPLKWTAVTDAPGRAGNSTLWSGNENNLDSAAIAQVTVPSANPTLTYTERHLAEAGYDYAYTVVSTDGGETYTPLANDNTVDGPYGPALNGDAADFVTQTFDLTPYAGQNILSASGTSATAASTTAAGTSTTSTSAARWSATARAPRPSSPRPRSTRSRSRTGTSGSWGST